MAVFQGVYKLRNGNIADVEKVEGVDGVVSRGLVRGAGRTCHYNGNGLAVFPRDADFDLMEKQREAAGQ